MFGLFKKRKDPTNEPPPPPLGWLAIEGAFAAIYPGQTPKHWAHGGVSRLHDLNDVPENPLDGVNMYDGGSFWHYVTFGMSDLYVKDGTSGWSGFGYEFTFRLEKSDGEAQPPLWPINVLVSLASSAYRGSELAPEHTVKIGPIDGSKDAKITALLIAQDPAFQLLQTPFGKLAFLQLVGVEGHVRERALATGVGVVLDELRAVDKHLVTRMR